MIRLMIPRAISLGLANSNLLIAYNIARRLAAARCRFQSRLMQLPQTLIGTAMGHRDFPDSGRAERQSGFERQARCDVSALRFVLIAWISSCLDHGRSRAAVSGTLGRRRLRSCHSADRVFAVLQMFAPGHPDLNLLEIGAQLLMPIRT